MRIDLLNADAKAELHAFAAKAFESCSVEPRDMRPVLVVGDPWRSILQQSAMHETGLIVMGTRGLGGVRKLLLGSTAEHVLRSTTVPVLLVPEGDQTASTGDPTAAVEHVVAATEFGPSSTMAVRLAAALAKDLSGDLILVNVVKPVSVPAQWRHYLDHSDEEQLSRARQHLARAAHEWLDDLPECSYVAALGDPAEAIASVSHDRGAGLIVMGLGNRYDFEGSRPGSIAYAVVRDAQVPVLVVPRVSPLLERRGRQNVRAQAPPAETRVVPTVLASTI